MRSQKSESGRRRTAWVDDYREERRQFAIGARILALLWAGFWMYFSLAERYRSHMGLVETLRDSWQYGLLSLIIALIALGWDVFGGILLIAAGIAWFMHYFPRVRAWYILMQIAPPLIAGMMLLASSRKPKENTL